MAERTDQRTRSADSTSERLDDGGLGTGVETDLGESATETTTSRSLTGRVRNRLTAPVSGLFSPRAFLYLFVVTFVASLLAGLVLPLGGAAGLLGIAAAAFGAGLVGDRRRYLELALAGGFTAGLGALLNNLVLTAFGLGVPLIVVGVGAGTLAGVAGHYFGRDLRDGLTRDI